MLPPAQEKGEVETQPDIEISNYSGPWQRIGSQFVDSLGTVRVKLKSKCTFIIKRKRIVDSHVENAPTKQVTGTN